MIWLKSAMRIPSSGCMCRTHTDHLARGFDALRDLPGVAKHRHAVDVESSEPKGAARRVFFIQIIEAPLLGWGNRDELDAFRAALDFARFCRCLRLLGQCGFPNGD